uniref:Pseudouridylate synthase RPUSD4, mitochondrial n=1 Tax=Schistocephalus solidus TaxID=70667 RepID=A0A0X3Q148_SCHSO
MSRKGGRTQVPSDSPRIKNSKPSQGKQAADEGEVSYIDNLFFGELPVAKCRPPGEPTDPVSPDLGVGDAGLIDQAYFREQPDKDPSMVASNPSVADFILGVRDQLSINQYTGHTIDFEERWQAAVFLNRRDSQGFRIPDDDAVKFYRLTEDEATEVLRHCIIFNQANIIVLNKPPGISSHGGPGQSFSVDSLLPRLAHKLLLGPYDEADTLQITHRLDKETTGALLISRNKDAHLRVTEAFANRWIRKSYLCITSRIPRSKDGLITLPIREKQIGGKYRMVAKLPAKSHEDVSTDNPETVLKSVSADTNSVTRYQLLDRRNDAALLQCTTFTGIRHQIRVHLSTALETPVLGDHKYSHFGFLAPQRLSNRTLEALQIRQSKVRYLGLHLHSHRLHFGVQGDEDAEERPPGSHPTPPGFFNFIERDTVRHSRDVLAPVPVFFLSNMKRLGLRFPKLIKWTRCRLF